MTFSKKMLELEEKLKAGGHEIILPKFTKEYAELDSAEKMHSESAKNKMDHDLIRDYYNEIDKSDAILVINEKRHDIENYIGGNSFLEMGFAHILDKKIFLLNRIPEMSYSDEIIAMNPIVINNDLNKIC